MKGMVVKMISLTLRIPIATILCVPSIVMTSVTRTTVSTLARRINGSTHQIGAERRKGSEYLRTGGGEDANERLLFLKYYKYSQKSFISSKA